MAANKYYVVWKGRKPGIYETWEECKLQVDKHQGAEYKSYRTLEEAARAYRDGPTVRFIKEGLGQELTPVQASVVRAIKKETGSKPIPEYTPEAKRILERLCGPGHDKDPRG